MILVDSIMPATCEVNYCADFIFLRQLNETLVDKLDPFLRFLFERKTMLCQKI